ncbi:hypothetical protein V8B55DRAFT_1558335 [Mucor lusitanicus]|uniref:Uncharacterized protein n=1 Tax=Mucor lusitanicus CBS 277.49 TaxID=747725 RepID=A0A168JVB1_MUCCL|nr:hypothetical protein MUCCIDRAFT_111002 [Mucor lusitanicus CBS 277.49]
MLNNLFLADDDIIIKLCWLEKLTDHTRSTKWGGIGFSVIKQHNATIPDKIDDKNKLIKGMKSVLAFTEALGNKVPIPIYYCRFYGYHLRQKRGSAFSKRYNAYWAERADTNDTATEVVKKRIFKMVTTVHDKICDAVENSTKIMEINKSVHEINRETSDEEVLGLDNQGVLDVSKDTIEEGELAELTSIGDIPGIDCQHHAKAIKEAPLSTILLRQALATSTLLPNEIFTIATHADLHFVEVIGTHLLNNPLRAKKLERDIAITVLNNRFLADNDIIIGLYPSSTVYKYTIGDIASLSVKHLAN